MDDPTAADPALVRLEEVTVRLGGRPALEAVSLELRPGTSLALMGPNGSGKTTLLRVLAGLIEPSTGTLRRAEGSLARGIGFVAQHQHQHRWMPLTVAEVIATARYRQRGLWRPLRAADRSACRQAASRLDVADLLRRPFTQLSGGQRQRVLVATALAVDAPLLLLDEPITGLDLPSQEVILDVLEHERGRGRAIVFSTHHLEEARRATRVALLNTVVVAEGPPGDVCTPVLLEEVFGQRVIDRGAPGAPLVIDDHGHGDHHSQG